VSHSLDVLVIGGGMITADLILPSLYHLRRQGVVGGISVCASRSSTVRTLSENSGIREAFPGQEFTAWPGEYTTAMRRLSPRQMVAVAVPDHLHRDIVLAALDADQHVLCVKPLALRYADAALIDTRAKDRGLFVGVEYHKRFDRRSLVARGEYRSGKLGEFVMGEARLIEPWRYRTSNFQTWFSAETTDPFVYVGCHYLDLVRFITGLLPVEVSVAGVRGRFANGVEGFFWSQGRVRWDNGALLSVANGLGYPDGAAGSNDQGLVMYCEGEGKTGLIRHEDHDRGVSYSYLAAESPERSPFQYVSPDFFRLVPWEGPGLRPLGYGFDSIEAIVKAAQSVEESAACAAPSAALQARRARCAEIDETGIIATPSNTGAVDLAVEAARVSILADGMPVRIIHGESPRVELRRAETSAKASAERERNARDTAPEGNARDTAPEGNARDTAQGRLNER